MSEIKGPILTVTVAGFVGKNAPNGTWPVKMPNPEGTVFGPHLVKIVVANQRVSLEVFNRCCGNRLKLSAKGMIAQLGSAFEVFGDGDFRRQKGIGSAT